MESGKRGRSGGGGRGRIRAARALLLALALLCIGHGVWNKSREDVFRKAVRICTECIGLG